MCEDVKSREWFVMKVADPLTFRERITRALACYEEQQGGEKHAFELRSLYDSCTEEQKKHRQSPDSGLVINYVFVKADYVFLQSFQQFCLKFGVGMWFLEVHFVAQRMMVATVSDAEMQQFVRFCEAYRMQAGNEPIPFIELTPETAQANDQALVTNGQFAGLKVVVDSDQDGVPEDSLRVFFVWFHVIGKRAILKKADLEIKHRAKYLNNKYATYDEFFDFLADETVFERYVNQAFTTEDLAKAMRMLKIANYDPNPENHRKRISLRLRLMNLTALIASAYILNDVTKLRTYQNYWKTIRPGMRHPHNEQAHWDEIVKVTL